MKGIVMDVRVVCQLTYNICLYCVVYDHHVTESRCTCVVNLHLRLDRQNWMIYNIDSRDFQSKFPENQIVVSVRSIIIVFCSFSYFQISIRMNISETDIYHNEY